MPRAFSATEIVMMVAKRTSHQLLHARLGHPGKTASGRFKVLVDGIAEALQACFCESCVQSKITRTPSKKVMTPVKNKLGRLHIDLCGPFPALSLEKNKIMLTCTDQESRNLKVKFTSTKKNVLDLLKEVKEEWESDCRKYHNGETIQCIHVDRGTEFLNQKTRDWCKLHRIKLEATVGYIPEANGIAERANRSILEKSNAMRIEAGLPAEYWEFACECAVYLRNRGPIKNKEITPWEDWYKEKPSVAHYKVFGCPAWVHIPKVKRDKIKTKAWKGVFVGYRDDTVTTYKIWVPSVQLVEEARFVIFDENHTHWDFKGLEDAQEAALEDDDGDSSGDDIDFRSSAIGTGGENGDDDGRDAESPNDTVPVVELGDMESDEEDPHPPIQPVENQPPGERLA
jgi:hypothetical protein